MPNSNQVISWELASEGTMVKLTFKSEISFAVTFADFRENTRDIMNSSLEEIYQKYLADKKTIVGIPVVPIESGKRAYIYDFVKNAVFKTSNVECYTFYGNDIVSVGTKNSNYIVATFGNKIVVPDVFVKRVNDMIKADEKK